MWLCSSSKEAQSLSPHFLNLGTAGTLLWPLEWKRLEAFRGLRKALTYFCSLLPLSITIRTYPGYPSWEAKSGPELCVPNYAPWGITRDSWSTPTTFPSLPHLPHKHIGEPRQNQPNSSQISWIPQTHGLNECLLLFASKFCWLFIMRHYAVICKLYTMSPFIFFFFPRA